MADRPGHVITVAAVTGGIVAIVLAVLVIGALVNLWWSLQESFGHAMFHKLEKIVMGAEYMQYFSLLVVLSMTAGALTAYFSRENVKKGKDAANAGMLTGLVIAVTFCLAATGIFVFASSGRPDFNLWYVIDNVTRVLIASLVVPAVVIMPLAAAGALLMHRNLSAADTTVSHDMYRDALIAMAAAIVLAGIITFLISQNYDIPAILPAIFSIPLLLTLPLLGAGAHVRRPNGRMPVVLIVLFLSVIAIVVLPLAGTWLACQTGVIYAEPYDWEHPHDPDVYMLVVQNVSQPVEDLARNLSEKNGFDWGMTLCESRADDPDSGIVASVNESTCDIGVITRALRPDEMAPGLDQVIVAGNGSAGSIVFVTKGDRPENLTGFIDYAAGPEGQAILSQYGYSL